MSKSDEIKQVWVEWALEQLSPIRFKGALLYSAAGTRGHKRLGRRELADSMYAKDMSLKPNLIDHVLDTLTSIAPDWSKYGRYIAFRDQVWDTVELEFAPNQLEYVYSSDIVPQPAGSKGYNDALQFLRQLAKNTDGLDGDYLQAMAPLLMARRPAGVVWFVGSGANGKSALLNALYLILGSHFASLTTAAIEDGKAIPALSGILGNIVRESSEARVEDTANYKAIGTHEPIHVRRLYTQDLVTVETDFHTIFNANNIPIFSDKTKGARRRTLVLPFPAHFEDNPTFEEVTFTPEFLGGLVTLLMEETHVIRDNYYAFNWSDATLKAKESYDSEVNSAEAFLAHLTDSKVVAFSNYTMLKLNYDNWCSQNGLVALSATTLKRTLTNDAGAVRKTVRVDNSPVNRYFFASAPNDDPLVWLDNGYGMVDITTAPEEALSKQGRLPGEW